MVTSEKGLGIRWIMDAASHALSVVAYCTSTAQTCMMPHALCLLLHTSVSHYPCEDTDATTELALLVVQVCIMALLPCMPDEHDKLLLMVHVIEIMLHAQPCC